MPYRARQWFKAAALPIVVAACSSSSSIPFGPLEAGAPDTAAPDTTAPTLVSRIPAPDQTQVWAFAPIVLEFSEPLDEASVSTDAFSVLAEGDPSKLPTHIGLSDDRRTVKVELSAIPKSPTRLTLQVAPTLRDPAGNVFAGAAWSWKVPVWFEKRDLADQAAKSRASLVLDEVGAAFVAWQERAGMGQQIRVARSTADTFEPIGDTLNLSNGSVASRPRIALSAGNPVVAWQETATDADVYVKRWDGASWVRLGDGPLDENASATAPVPFVDPSGVIFVAWLEGETRVRVARWNVSSWEPVADVYTAAHAVAGFDFVVHAGGPCLAVAESGPSGTLSIVSWNAGARAWQPQGATLERRKGDALAGPALASDGGDGLAAAWEEHDGVSTNVYVARYDAPSGRWNLLGRALDLDLDAPSGSAELRFGGAGPVVSWLEGTGGSARSYVARWTAGAWEALGSFHSADRDGPFAMAVDARSFPAIARGADGAIEVRRFNGTPELPFGLPLRAGASPCKLPASDAIDFPKVLSETGCYSDIAKRETAPGVVPYDINSPLWSDGASKRRFIIVPEGQKLAMTEEDSWEVPPGTMFMKEFWLEREPGNPSSRYPVETRLLVNRCLEGDCVGPWEGFSYQWNAEGTEATLLDNKRDPETRAWPVGSHEHVHAYPARIQCTQCHLLAAGGSLGVQTAQLNRNFDYGSGVVDNQLRALEHAGFVERKTGLSVAPAELARVPTPNDVSFTLEERTRGYLQGNCAHCHRPGGSWPVVDYRYQVGLGHSKICALLTPGSAETSPLYLKDSVRKPEDLPPDVRGGPMPPIGSLIADQRQLVTTKAWIDGMTSCP